MKTKNDKSSSGTRGYVALHELHLRPFSGQEDYQLIASIREQMRLAEEVEYVTKPQDLANRFKHLESFNITRDICLAQSGNETIGAAYVHWEKEEHSPKRVYFPQMDLLPAWLGSGADTLLQEWIEKRVHEINNEQSWKGASELAQEAIPSDEPRIKLLNEFGYSPIRYYFRMARSLEDLPKDILPEGITVKPVLPGQLRALWESASQAFKDEWGATQPTEGWFQEWQNDRNFQPLIWQVAWNGDHIIGSVLNYIDSIENETYQRFRGYTEGISVLREWRGKGVASALICKSLAMLKTLNMTEAALTVDSQNPSGARGLYERLGYKPYRTIIEFRKPLDS